MKTRSLFHFFFLHHLISQVWGSGHQSIFIAKFKHLFACPGNEEMFSVPYLLYRSYICAIVHMMPVSFLYVIFAVQRCCSLWHCQRPEIKNLREDNTLNNKRR